jgi:hypothetical protein
VVRDFACDPMKKPIKNRELGGSGDTCIRGARQAALGNGWCGMAR